MPRQRHLCVTLLHLLLTCLALLPAAPCAADNASPLKTIIVDDYHPYTFMDSNGQPDGFSVDLIKAVCAAMDMQVAIVPGPWNTAMRELQEGRIDLLPMMAYSLDRDKYFDFSVPHTIAYDAIFTKEGRPTVSTLKELSGKKVIVMQNDLAHNYLVLSGLSRSMELILVDSLPEALHRLGSGEADAAIMPKLVGLIVLEKSNIKGIATQSHVIDEYTRPFSFAVREGNKVLLERLTQGLSIVKRTGEYDRIYAKWFGELETPRMDLTIVKYALLSLGLGFLAFIVWITLLRRQVLSKTRHLKQEITLRETKEQSLLESEQRYLAMVDSQTELVSRFDATGIFTFANEGFCRFFGKTREEVLGTNWSPVALAEDLPMIRERLAFLSPENPLVTVENRNTRADGEVRWVQFTNRGFFAENGELKEIQSVGRDITERKQAEEALLENVHKFRGIFDRSPVGMMLFNDQGIVLEANGAMEGVFGNPRDKYLGLSLLEMMSEEPFRQSVVQAISGKENFVEGEYTSVLNGKRLFLRAQANKIAQNLNMVFLEDISQAKAMELSLVDAKHIAEVANRAKSEFLANMSHEIRTPLNGVLGMLQLIRDSEVPGAVESYAEMGIRAGQRLTSLLGDILDLSRIEAGRMHIASNPFSLANIFIALSETFSPMHHSKRLSLEINVAPDVPTDLTGDEIRVRQVLFNLVGNAMKFSDQGEVRVEVSTLLPHPSGLARLLFIVSDTGLGIPDDKIDQIAAPFTQVSGDFRRSHQGAGLGLAIAHHLVDAMGGTLTFESTEGQGTSVYLMLPFGLLEPSAIPVTPQTTGPGPTCLAPLQLLLVEDEEISRMSARLTLEKMGHQVVTANNGEEALEALRGSNFDCVLMDVQMDVLDGVEATRRIRSGSSGVLDAQVPIIAITAYAMTGDRERFIEAGMDDYVAKPMSVEELKKTLGRVAEKMGKIGAE